MLVSKLGLVFLCTVYGSLVAQTTSQGVEKLRVQEGLLLVNKRKEKNTEVGVTPNISNGGVAVTFSHKKRRVLMETVEKKGGFVEFPMNDECLMNTECRRDILDRIIHVVDNGIGYKAVRQITSGN